MNKPENSFGAIVVMGVSGCGKSTVGRLLAADLGCSFIEGDEFHDAANIAKMQARLPLTDDDRWPWLDRVGEALQIAVAENGTAVAACSALKRSYRDRLARAANVPVSFILLNATRAELLRRVRDRLDHFMPATLLDSQLDILEHPQSSEPALILNAAPPVNLSQSIRAWLNP